jgi:hypothetical protein
MMLRPAVFDCQGTPPPAAQMLDKDWLDFIATVLAEV